MRKWIKYSILILLLASGVVLCAVRWQAWFGMPSEPKWTGDTIQYSFPSPACDSDLTILVLGDIHTRLTRADYDTLAARVPQIDFVAQTGDWLERGQVYYAQLLLREWTASQLMGLPVLACPGQHEYTKGPIKTLSPIWEELFTHPNNGPVVPGASYYVDFPQMRFIVIDTNPMTRLVNLVRTLTWLREVMASAGDRYIVVMMHHPVLAPAKGQFNPLLYATFRHALGEADLVLSGHDHSYMRHTPFIVLNTAGKPKPQHLGFSAEVTDSIPVYGVINLQPDNANLQFTVHRLSDGSVIDSLYVKHD